jgi:hypothetical protein
MNVMLEASSTAPLFLCIFVFMANSIYSKQIACRRKYEYIH